MSIGLIDASTLCNLVPVAGRDQHRSTVRADMARFIKQGVTLLLPMAAIMETGNHIAHLADGRARRETAQRFARIVTDAVGGKAPFTPTPLLGTSEIVGCLEEFPDCAMRGMGFGDLSIVKEFERQCEMHPYHRVFVWSLDGHLTSYDRPART